MFLAGLAAACLPIRVRAAEDTTGVTATELKIGNTAAYSGPASAYGIIASTEAAVFNMINEQGGVGGRKIVYDLLDDAYSPPNTVDQVRSWSRKTRSRSSSRRSARRPIRRSPAIQQQGCAADLFGQRRE